MSDRKLVLIVLSLFLLEIVASFVFIAREKKIFEKKEKPTFISYVGLWDPKIINPLKVEFQRQHPNVTVEYEKKDPRLYYETLKNLISSDKSPDIFWWHSGLGPLLKEHLAKLDEATLSTADYERTYYPITKADAKIGGFYRGIPLEIDGLALIYNKKLFAEKKLVKPPKTWSELQRVYVPALNKYDKKKGVLRSAIALGTANNISNFSEIVGLLLFQNGVSFVKNADVNVNKSLAINKDNLGERAIEFYTSFIAGKSRVWDTTLPNSIRAFAKGKVAMIILPAYKLPSLQTQVRAYGNKAKLGVAELPQPPNRTPVTWASYWLSGVSLKSEHQKEAWEFIKFLSEPDNLRKIFKEEVKMRKVGRPYPRVDMNKELRKDPLLVPYISQAPYAKSFYLHPETFDKSLNDGMVGAATELVTRMVEGKGATKSNLKKFAEKSKEILSRYGVLNPDIVER